MADGSSQADIRSLEIEKMARGFAEIDNVFKNFVRNQSTTARKIRWYRKTSGFLDSTDTTGITASQIANVAEKALPVVVEATWTRLETDVRKYFVTSPLFSIEDLRDTDIRILQTNIRDLTRAVQNQIDKRIYNVITDTQATGSASVNTAAATANGWDDTTNGNPVLDIMVGLENISTQGYSVNNIIVAMDPNNYKDLLNYLITIKGSSIPGFSSEQIKSNVLMMLLGCKIVVSPNVVADSVAMWNPEAAGAWLIFMPLQTAVIEDKGIGARIRIWEEGEAILTDPKAVHVITDTNT